MDLSPKNEGSYESKTPQNYPLWKLENAPLCQVGHLPVGNDLL